MQNKDLLTIYNILSLFDKDEETFTNKIRQIFEIFEYSYDGIYITDGEANTISAVGVFDNYILLLVIFISTTTFFSSKIQNTPLKIKFTSVFFIHL